MPRRVLPDTRRGLLYRLFPNPTRLFLDSVGSSLTPKHDQSDVVACELVKSVKSRGHEGPNKWNKRL